MSTLVVEVLRGPRRSTRTPHADSLEFIIVKGWQVIVQKALGARRRSIESSIFPPDKRAPRPEVGRPPGGSRKYPRAPCPGRSNGTRQAGAQGPRRPGSVASRVYGHDRPTPSIRPGRFGRRRPGTTTASPSFEPARAAHRRGRLCRPWAAFHGYTDIENIRQTSPGGAPAPARGGRHHREAPRQELPTGP